ncbi:MAG: nuclear transport factor 2 family protein [Burkholderiales bacterium]|nr:MAG: nuclear transport factor 2 family protein [Burkholderiales bacterium]
MPVSSEDYAFVSQHLAQYCWTVDEIDGDGWAALFTPDGVFAGALPEDIAGNEALRQVPVNAGMGIPEMRHFITNLTCEYAGRPDKITARYYTCITSWQGAGQFYALALATADLVRGGDGWLIKRSNNVMLPRMPA